MCYKGVLSPCPGPLPEPAAEASAYFEHGGRQQTPAYLLSDLTPGHVVEGPVLLIDDISTIVVRCSAGFLQRRFLSCLSSCWI
jgi:N-methylhydantoinase A/oxoprolinase/acetone carboxylase beta subunit